MRTGLDTLPVLAMRPEFAKWVVEGRKTSTLRSKPFEPGRYLMKRYGKPYATVEVSAAQPRLWPVESWTALEAALRHAIARQEGFATVRQFESTLYELKLYGNYWLRPFLAGEQPMYLHLLSNAEVVKCAQD